MVSNSTGDLEVRTFATVGAWEAWLAKQSENCPGLWLKIAKKGSGIESINYAEALDVALCFGWIDGQKAGFDDRYFLQRFTPRRPKSKWSKINCGHIERLITEGRIRPGGMRQVDAAKADGRWDAAYDGQRDAKVPDDLAAALANNAKAKRFFESLNSVNRYAILYRIQDAKKPETRARRIETFVAMLLEEKTLHPKA